MVAIKDVANMAWVLELDDPFQPKPYRDSVKHSYDSLLLEKVTERRLATSETTVWLLCMKWAPHRQCF